MGDRVQDLPCGLGIAQGPMSGVQSLPAATLYPGAGTHDARPTAGVGRGARVDAVRGAGADQGVPVERRVVGGDAGVVQEPGDRGPQLGQGRGAGQVLVGDAVHGPRCGGDRAGRADEGVQQDPAVGVDATQLADLAVEVGGLGVQTTTRCRCRRVQVRRRVVKAASGWRLMPRIVPGGCDIGRLARRGLGSAVSVGPATTWVMWRIAPIGACQMVCVSGGFLDLKELDCEHDR